MSGTEAPDAGTQPPRLNHSASTPMEAPNANSMAPQSQPRQQHNLPLPLLCRALMSALPCLHLKHRAICLEQRYRNNINFNIAKNPQAVKNFPLKKGIERFYTNPNLPFQREGLLGAYAVKPRTTTKLVSRSLEGGTSMLPSRIQKN